MNVRKFITALCMVGGGIALATAQETKLSNPVSLSTLATDVEDFMDVNAFENLEFDKVFTYAGWSDTKDIGTNSFNMGVAKKFGSLYTGIFFDADFTGFTNTISTTTRNNYKSSIGTATANDNNTFTFSALVGIGNLGIKGSVLFANDAESGNTGTSSSTTSGSSTTDSTTLTKNYELYPELRAGLNLDVGSVALSPYAYFGLDINPSYTYEKTTVTNYGTTEKKNDTSHTWILFGLGSGIGLPEGEMATHSFSAALDFAFDSYGVGNVSSTANSSTTTKKYGNGIVTFTPGWTVELAPIETVTVTFDTTLPFKFTNSNDERYVTITTSGSTTSAYASATTTTGVLLNVDPELNIAVDWQAAPKLGIHVGADVALPLVSINNTTAVTYNGTSDSRSESSRTTTHTFTFGPNSSSDFTLTWDSGFRFDLTKNVLFDCSWNVVGDFFANFSENSTWTSNSSFWGGMGNLFYHSLSFLISVKL